MEDNVRKIMYICMCDWVALLYSRKLTEHCKPTIMEKIKIVKKETIKKIKIKVSQGMHLPVSRGESFVSSPSI